MAPTIEARGLKKRFGSVEALAGLDLLAESGHVTALLGPNGAGKTTFVNAIATLLQPMRVSYGSPGSIRFPSRAGYAKPSVSRVRAPRWSPP